MQVAEEGLFVPAEGDKAYRYRNTHIDADLAAAHKIYGRDLTRIPSIGWFADTVGKLIQGRIQSMG